ncbi:MAG: metalloprotease PmbA [Gammaproteobacteria bacterium]|nr:metalloprotease PmbA [Gammaproteobacteria bacterium]MBT7308044.1 metalloprotease PmbA [Gammaproteobacteria bacterium]
METLTQQILDEATRQGASAAEAGSRVEEGYTSTVRMGEVETIEHHKDRGMGVTVYFGEHKGTASTSDFSSDAVVQAVRAACDIARYTQADEYAGLADPEQLASEFPELELDHPWSVGVEESIDLAKRCEQSALEYDPRVVNSDGGSVSSHRSIRVYGNSHGFLSGYGSSRHGISCSVIAREPGSEDMQRNYWYSSVRDPEQLETVSEIGEMAARRTLDRLGSRKGKTGQAPVLFDATIAGGLLGHLVGAIRGGSLYRKASFLLDQLGQPLFPEWVSVYEEPHLKRAAASASFDSDGVATRQNNFVTEGVLSSYVLDCYSARRLGMETTGNGGGVRNLRMSHGELELSGLLKKMGEGLLVTELMGQGVNTLTGDYSRGAAGFWVEGGEIAYPVDEITIAGNLKEMFAGIVEVGADTDLRGNIQTGSILLEQMSIAGE